MLRGALLLSALLVAGAALGETPRLPAGRVEIAVEDLHCATCAKKVARKLYAVKGVLKVTSSLKDNVVSVSLSPKLRTIPAGRLWVAAEEAGFPPAELRYADQRLDAEAMKPLLAALPSAKTTR